MKYLVDEDSSLWLYFRRYELKEGPDGRKYIMPDQNSYPWPYNVLEKKEELVLDAVNVGLLVLGKKSEDVIQDAVMEFVSKYGLLGMMTALPVTPEYMEYDITFFPPNRFIREKGMSTDDYQKIFYPFHNLEQIRKTLEPDWDDRRQLRFWELRNIAGNQPETVRMSFMHEYAEPYDWIVTQFKDWAYMLTCCYFYYKDGKLNDLRTILALQDGLAAFGGVYPNYYLMLRDKPTISWEFHSLQQFIHLMLSFMLNGKSCANRALSPLLETPKSRNQQSLYNPSHFEICTHKLKKGVCTYISQNAKILTVNPPASEGKTVRIFKAAFMRTREIFMRHAAARSNGRRIVFLQFSLALVFGNQKYMIVSELKSAE